MDIGPRVRERRAALGLSQEQLARQAEVSLNAIHKLEMGRITDPHFSTLSAIAGALDTTVAELVGEELYGWVRNETTEDLRRMALEEAQYAKAPTVEEFLEEHKADKKASNEKAHRRTLAYTNIIAINAELYERGVRSPVELAIKQYNEAMGADSVPEEAADEASEAG